MNKNIIFFAEVGKTNFSSKTSEELLKNLYSKISKQLGNEFVKLYFYPIFDISNFTKWIYHSKQKSYPKNNFFYLSSSSIKLIRDLIYIFSIVRKSIKNQSSNIIIYNLNKFQLYLLFLFKFLIPSKISFIQADGSLLKKYEINIFDEVYVFSQYLYKNYKFSNKNVNINYCLPYVNSANLSSRNIITKKTFDKNTFKYLIHCGSISEYNLSELKLRKLGIFCENNQKYKVIFTSSQLDIPNYFKLKLEEYSRYFVYYNNLKEEQLLGLFKLTSYGLDLRDSDCFNSYIDFPSKLITYFTNNLPVISTCSKSIPSNFKKLILKFDNLEDLKNINNKDFNENIFINVKEFINEKSLDKTILNTLKI